MTPAAFRATIHGLKTVPTRKVCQLTVEFPIEELARVAAIAEHGAWVGIARLEEPGLSQKEQAREPGRLKTPVPRRQESAPADAEPRPWDALPLPTQAAIRCNDPLFRAFVRERKKWPLDAAAYVRSACGVASRSFLTLDNKSGTNWRAIDSEFLSWKAAERAGAA